MALPVFVRFSCSHPHSPLAFIPSFLPRFYLYLWDLFRGDDIPSIAIFSSATSAPFSPAASVPVAAVTVETAAWWTVNRRLTTSTEKVIWTLCSPWAWARNGSRTCVKRFLIKLLLREHFLILAVRPRSPIWVFDSPAVRVGFPCLARLAMSSQLISMVFCKPFSDSH